MSQNETQSRSGGELVGDTMSKQAIYKFQYSAGRHGDLVGTFIAAAEDIDFAHGHRVSFYEPWGKHSSCALTLDRSMFTLVSDNQLVVDIFDKLNLRNGSAPLALLHDSIADGRVELTAEQEESASEYFRTAIEYRKKATRR